MVKVVRRRAMKWIRRYDIQIKKLLTHDYDPHADPEVFVNAMDKLEKKKKKMIDWRKRELARVYRM